jgi:hypothetical protein
MLPLTQTLFAVAFLLVIGFQAGMSTAEGVIIGILAGLGLGNEVIRLWAAATADSDPVLPSPEDDFIA